MSGRAGIISSTNRQQVTGRNSVLNFAALPLSGNSVGDVFYVLEPQGRVPTFNLKRSGEYRWTGTEWRRFGAIPSEVIIESEHGAPSHDPLVPYYEGNLIWHNSNLHRCKADIAPKAYDANDWDVINSSSFWEATNTEHTTSYIYKGGLNGTAWQINRYDRNSNMTRTAAKQSNNSSYTTLAAAWADRTTLNY